MPHPDLLLSLLTARQMREIEIYAEIEPIGRDIGFSRPAKDDDVVEEKLNAFFGRYETK